MASRVAEGLVFAMILGLALPCEIRPRLSVSVVDEFLIEMLIGVALRALALGADGRGARALRVGGLRRAGGEHPAAGDRHQDRRACLLGRDGDHRRGERNRA